MPRTEPDAPNPIDKWKVQLRKGCLELAVMASLWSGKLYGLEILRRLADGSNLTVPEGTVYPLLARLRTVGWVKSEWVEAEAEHPRKYYSLTPSGRRHVAEMARSWTTFTASIDQLLVPLQKEES